MLEMSVTFNNAFVSRQLKKTQWTTAKSLLILLILSMPLSLFKNAVGRSQGKKI
jgi:hypothetical protein